MRHEATQYIPFQPEGHKPDSKFKSLIGRKFHWLTPISRAENATGGRASWLCRCECGNEKVVRGDHLKAGKIKSCGCKVAELLSALDRSPKLGHTRNVYDAMKDRCLYASTPSYPRYGGAGVKICKRWLESYENFLRDVGERPLGMSLDRKDCLGHYSCGHCEECNQNGWTANCRWATPKEQSRNLCLHLHFTFAGVTLPLREFVTEFDLEELWFLRCLRQGYTVCDAVSLSRAR